MMMTNELTTGTRVNATLKGETYIGVVQKAFKTGGALVLLDGDEKATKFAAADIEIRKRGRKSLEETMSPAEMKAEQKSLIAELEAADTIEERKRIRRLLRRRGHTGGLGLRPITVQSINA